MYLLNLALLFSSPVDAARCGSDAAVRTDAAEQLIREAHAADLDGDGWPELLIGTWIWSEPGERAGAVYRISDRR